MAQDVRVTRQDVQEMAGAINYALFSANGLVTKLPPDEAQMVVDTDVYVEDVPTAHDLALLNQDSDNGRRLLGLFVNPPAVITVYAAAVMRAGYDPVDVAIHEVGHRLNYDHSLREAQIAMISPGAHSTPAMAQVVETRVVTAPDSCPFCLYHARTAEVLALLNGLRVRSMLQHQVPMGLGGTIPLAARKVAEARGALGVASVYIPDRAGEVREADAYLAELQRRLQNPAMSPEDVAQAAQVADQAWDRAYDLNWVYWLRQTHPEVAVRPEYAAPASCPGCGAPSSAWAA